jgi:SAM-dependent methyltransferase
MYGTESDDPTVALSAVGALTLDAEQAALLRGAIASGFLSRCIEPTTVESLAAASGLSLALVTDLCAALQGAGILEADGSGRWLNRFYAALLRQGLGPHVVNLLDASTVRQRLLTEMFSPHGPEDFWQVSNEERRVLAASVTVEPSSPFAQWVMDLSVGSVPAWHAAFDAGARYLELGCGVGSAMLTFARLYPGLTAVGVDVSADLIDHARAQAFRLALAGRCTFVAADAAAYTDPDPFDVVLWSQPYFAPGSRQGSLANAYARLRPGGLLIAPVPGPPRGPDSPRASIETLLMRSWGLPAATGTDVAGEIEAAGFGAATIHPGRHLTVVAARRPAATARPSAGLIAGATGQISARITGEPPPGQVRW